MLVISGVYGVYCVFGVYAVCVCVHVFHFVYSRYVTERQRCISFRRINNLFCSGKYTIDLAYEVFAINNCNILQIGLAFVLFLFVVCVGQPTRVNLFKLVPLTLTLFLSVELY